MECLPGNVERGYKMGFWLYMLLMDLLIPFIMIVFGKSWMRTAPKKINHIYGYRTSMSMKNIDTWVFAHYYCGKLWYRCGVVLFPVSIIVMGLVFGKTDDVVGTVGGILGGVQMIPLISSIIPTEKALRRTFDHNGKRR